jgi:hypothetical protein
MSRTACKKRRVKLHGRQLGSSEMSLRILAVGHSAGGLLAALCSLHNLHNNNMPSFYEVSFSDTVPVLLEDPSCPALC